MPDFAPPATPRYIARYSAAGVPHNIMVRGFRGEASSATILRGRETLFGLMDALSSVLVDDFTWTSAAYIPQDSEISIIAAVPDPITGAVDPTTLSPEDKIKTLGFAGKSDAPTGSKVSMKVFGFNWTTDTTAASAQKKFVLLDTDAAFIAAAIAVLNAAEVACIDNGIAGWHNRTTIKTNDKWLKQVRRGVIT